MDIYDNVFSFEQRHRFYNFALNSSYRLSRSASEIPEASKWGKTLACNFSNSDMKNFLFFENDFVKEKILEQQLRIRRCYINLSTLSDFNYYHIDCNDGAGITSLLYLNFEWSPTWEGETHFCNDDMDDVMLSVTPKPGRLVFFDSSIPHKSSNPSVNSEFYRYVFTVKYAKPIHIKYDESVGLEQIIKERE